MSQITDLISKIIAAGPKAQEALVEVDRGVTSGREMVAHFQQAGVIMFGRSAGERPAATLTAQEESELESACTQLQSQSEGVAADRAGFLDMLKRAALFIKEHPELFTFLFTFIK